MSRRPSSTSGPRRSQEDFERALTGSANTQYVSSSDPDRILPGPTSTGPPRSRQGSSAGATLPGISETITHPETTVGLPRPEPGPSRPSHLSDQSKTSESSSYRIFDGEDRHRNFRSTTATHKGASFGIDAELGPTNDKAQISKRRSIFRSAGTASTPDLNHRNNTSGQAAVSNVTPAPQDSRTKRNLAPPLVMPQGEYGATEYFSSPTKQRQGSPGADNKPVVMGNRDRSASHGPAAVQPPSQMSTGTQRSMNTMSSRSNSVQSPKSSTVTNRTGSALGEDGTKSVRSKTKGFWGKLFSSNRDETPNKSSPIFKPSPSAQHLPLGSSSMDRKFNTAPQVPAAPAPPRKDSAISAISATSPLRSPGRESIPSSHAEVPSPSHPPRTASRHLREPATQIGDNSDEEDGVLARPETARRRSSATKSVAGDSTPARMDQWRRHVEGMLEGDSIERDLAMELGVPAQSMTLRDRFEGSSPQKASSPESPLGDSSLKADQDLLSHPSRANTSGSSPKIPLAPTLSTRVSSLAMSDPITTPTNQNSPNLAVSTPPTRPSRHLRYPTQSEDDRETTDNEPSPAGDGTIKRLSDEDASTLHGRGTPVAADSTDLTADNQSGMTPLAAGRNPYAFPLDIDPEAHQDLDAEAKTIAQAAFQGEESSVKKDRMAEYIGGIKPINRLALQYYIAQFAFGGMRVDDAFRQLCQKLYLKAETQEIDRILEAFSQRYFECNPSTIFSSPAVVHTVTGSFLLLNTDLHIAEISEHMSRQQYVRLTMDTITSHVLKENMSRHASTPELVHNDSNSTLRTSIASAQSPPAHNTGSHKLGAAINFDREGSSDLLNRKDSFASVERVSDRTQRHSMLAVTNLGKVPASQDARGRLSSSASVGSMAQQGGKWEAELEAALKEIYQSVKAKQILLPTAHEYAFRAPLSAGRHPMLRSTSDTSGSDRLSSHKRGSIRGMQGLGPGSHHQDGRSSPTPSQATSIGEHVDKHYPSGPAFGFASNLTHTVIREHEDEAASIAESDTTDGTEDMTDDQLALLGPPWAKEGNLQRKPYWDGPGKRSKEKNWRQVFTVLQQGDIYMFSFDEGSGRAVPKGLAMGGGNWMTNARGQGDMNLSHALASALPPPGYNTQRPWCFSLTLHNGEMSFFQAGTEDLVQEWVSTCNYWAARRSRPPLPGGVSNLDYGWKALESSDQPEDHTDSQSVFSNRSAKSRLSMHRTLGRRNMPAERNYLSDWKAPQPSLIPSKLDEEAQLESLQKHSQSLIKELTAHKALEAPLAKFYPPRSVNGSKAQENWKHRSLYIHSEIVKYEVYTDALKSAINLRFKKQGEKKLEKSLKRNMEIDENEDDFYDYLHDTNVRLTPVERKGN